MASQPYLNKSKATWYCKTRFEGRWVERKLGKHPIPFSPSKPPSKPPRDIQARRDALANMEADRRVGLPGTSSTNLAKFIAEYRAAFAVRRKPKSLELLDRYTASFLALCREEKIHAVEQVNKAVCIKYMERRSAAGVSANTIKTERGYLAPIFAKAETIEIITRNPWTKTELPGRAIPGEPVFWSREEVAAIVVAIKKQWHKDAVLVLANTGLRVDALLEMRWAWIDWSAGVIRVPPMNDKAKSGYNCPINDTTRDILSRLNVHSGAEIVFENPATEDRYSYQSLRSALKRALRQAGVRVGTIHDFRHTFGRSFALSGAPITVVQAALGHHSLQMTQRYTNVGGEAAVPFMEGFNVGRTVTANDVGPPASTLELASSDVPERKPRPMPPREPERAMALPPSAASESPQRRPRAPREPSRAEIALMRAREREAAALAKLKAHRETQRLAKAANDERRRAAKEEARNRPRRNSFDLDALRARLDAQAKGPKAS
jgi:integrase